jgi:hypothetical protein
MKSVKKYSRLDYSDFDILGSSNLLNTPRPSIEELHILSTKSSTLKVELNKKQKVKMKKEHTKKRDDGRLRPLFKLGKDGQIIDILTDKEFENRNN